MRDKKKGPESIFSPVGKIRLEFLKCHTDFSDKRLAKELMSNINYQILCDVYFSLEMSKFNYELISMIRVEISKKLKIKKFQIILYNYWPPYIKNANTCLFDATCYENYIIFPSNIKLIFRNIEWLDQFLSKYAKESNLKRNRYKR